MTNEEKQKLNNKIHGWIIPNSDLTFGEADEMCACDFLMTSMLA